MSKTSDVEGYFKWSESHPVPPLPTLSAGDALAKLQSTEFSSLASVIELADAIQDCTPIPLVQDKRRQYVVVPGPPALTIGDETSDPTPVPIGTKLTIHPNFNMLVQAKLAPPPPKSRPALPKFVYPLQRELTLTTLGDKVDDSPVEETTTPSSWMLCLPTTQSGWSTTVTRTTQRPVSLSRPTQLKCPPSWTANFDAAQAVAKLKAWSVNPPLPTLTDFKKLVNATKTQGAVTPSTVWMDSLSKAFTAATAARTPK
jgi:hypothetical protein